jgi:hypothetical protein
VVAPGEPGEERLVEPALAELWCRQQFVVEAYEVIGTDPNFESA